MKRYYQLRIINFSIVAVPCNLDGKLSYVVSNFTVEAMVKIIIKETLYDLKILLNKFKKEGKCLFIVIFLLFEHTESFNTMMHTRN